MIRVNLLPYRAKRKKENVQHQVVVFLLMFVILLIGIFTFNSCMESKVEDLKERVAAAQKDLDANKKKAAEVDRLTKDLNDLQKKTDIIQNLNKKRKEPVVLLDKMTGIVVEDRMWFTQFSDVGNVVSINGVATDSDAVAEFLKNLELSNLFYEVKLLKTELKEVGKKSLQNFQVRCTKEAPKPPPKDTKKGKKKK